MKKNNKLLRQAQVLLEDTKNIVKKNAKRNKMNWVSDIDSQLILYDKQSKKIDDLTDIPVTINKAKLAHYPTKKEMNDEMNIVYGSFFLNEDLDDTTKSQWLTARELMEQLYKNSMLGNHVFLPSAIEIYRYGYITPYGYWSHLTEHEQFASAASNANRKNDMIFLDSELIAVDIDTQTKKPIDFINVIPPSIKSMLVGIIPTPSYGYTDSDGVTTYGCRLLLSVPSLFKMAERWNYKVDRDGKISLLTFAQKQLYRCNKSGLEKWGIQVELEYREDDEKHNEMLDKKAGRIFYRKLVIEIYKRMYNAIVFYILNKTDIEVDADNNPDPQQLVRCGRGDYIINCGVQQMTVQQMVNLDNYRIKLNQEKAVAETIQSIENANDEVIDVYNNTSPQITLISQEGRNDTDKAEEDKSKGNSKAELYDDWIIKWTERVGYIDDTKTWHKALLAIASLNAQGRIESKDAQIAAHAITYEKDYSAYDKWAINKVGQNSDPRDFPGQKYLMELYEDNGGNKYELYKIPPAEKLNREERDKKQTQLYVEHFGSKYCPLTIDGLDGKTIKKYILNNSGRILLHAPTGSGKTHGIFHGIADFYKSGKGSEIGITIIAMPNVTNISQTSVKYGGLLDKMFFGSASQGIYKNKGAYDQAIRDAYNNNCKVFVVTYDCAQRVYNQILQLETSITLDYLIVDEVHQGVTSYNYRNIALDNLFKLIEKAEIFIGMSGTIVDVDLNDFDKLVDVTLNKGNAIPAKNFFVLEHSDNNKVIDEIVRTIRGYLDGDIEQILIFLEHKMSQKRLAKTLGKLGYSTIIVNADNKENDDVVELTSAEYIDRQVVIATSAISDGISLRNDENSICIVVSSTQSQIWSPTVIRQMSARFRNTYRAFIWMRPRINEKEKNRRNGKVLSTQQYYKVKKKTSESLLDELKGLELLENNQKGIPTVYLDVLEKQHRIKYDEYNTLYIEYKGVYYDAFSAKNDSYKHNLITLQDDIAFMIGLDITTVYNNVILLESDVICREEVDKKIKEEQGIIKKNYLADIENIITRDIYYKILAGGEHYGTLDKSYKKVNDFINAIPDGLRPGILANRFLPYDDFMRFCKTHLGSNRKMNWYKDTLEVYTDYIAYTKCGYDNKTKAIIEFIDQTIKDLIAEYGVATSQSKAGVVESGDYLLKGIVDAIPNEAFSNVQNIGGYKVNENAVKTIYEKYYKHHIIKSIRIYEKEKRNIYGEVISGNESEAIKQVNVCEIHHTYDNNYVFERLGLKEDETERLDKLVYYYARAYKLDYPQLIKYLKKEDYGAGFKIPENISRHSKIKHN